MDEQEQVILDPALIQEVVDAAARQSEPRSRLDDGTVSADTIRELLRNTMETTYGRTLEGDELDRAFQEVAKRQYEHTAPHHPVQRVLAEIYVERKKHATRGLIVAGASLALWGALVGGGKLLTQAKESLYRNSVTADISQLRRHLQEPIVSTLQNNEFIARLPASDARVYKDAVAAATHAQNRLRGTLTQYDGPEFSISVANRPHIDSMMLASKFLADSLEEHVRVASAILETQMSLEEISSESRDIYKTIGQDAPAAFRAQAQPLYQAAIAAVAARNVPAAKSAVASLKDLSGSIAEYGLLEHSLQSAYAHVRNVVREPSVGSEASQIYQDGTSALQHAQLDRAHHAVDALNTIDEQVSQACTVRIRSEIETGYWLNTMPDGRPMTRQYYLIAHCVTSDGAEIRLPIFDDRLRTSATVPVWSVNVDSISFFSTVADKQEHLRVTYDIIGEKPRGYRTPNMSRFAGSHTLHSWEQYEDE